MPPEKFDGQSDDTCRCDQDLVVPRVKDEHDLTRKGVILRQVIFALLLALAIKPVWWAPGGDAPNYLGIARALAQDGQLTCLGNEHLYYPPGVSFFYAPAFWTGDRPFLLLSIFQRLASILVMLCGYRWLRQWLNRDRSILIIALFLFNMSTWGYYLRFLSEMWFCALLFGLAVIYHMLYQAMDQKQLGKAWAWALLSIPMLGWLILTRVVGVFIAGGLGLSLLAACLSWKCRKRWAHGLAIAVLLNALGGAFACGWISYEKSLAEAQQERTYTNHAFEHQQDQSSFQILTDNVHRRINTVGRLVVPGLFRTYAEDGHWLNALMLLYVPLSLLVLWGYIRLIRHNRDALVWMVPLYVGMYLIWPYGQGTRFFIPIFPVILLSLYKVVETKKWCNTLLIVMLITHMIVTVGRVASEYPKQIQRHQRWPAIDALVEHIHKIDQVDPSQQIVTRDIDSDITGMIKFAADRPVELGRSYQQVAAPDYLIISQNATVPDGYSFEFVVEKLLMVKRNVKP